MKIVIDLKFLQSIASILLHGSTVYLRDIERWYDPWPRDHGKYTAWSLHGPVQGRCNERWPSIGSTDLGLKSFHISAYIYKF